MFSLPPSAAIAMETGAMGQSVLYRLLAVGEIPPRRLRSPAICARWRR